MKRIMISLMALALLALLCACGETEQTAAQNPAPAAAETAEQKAPETSAPAQDPAEAPEEAAEEAPEEETAEQSPLETALAFVDHDAGELVAAIGEPLETSYEESCAGPGEDGIWTYDGFTVFTYRENDVETIVDAE